MLRENARFEVCPDPRPRAVETCDHCGHRTVCIRKACPVCKLLHSVCQRCQDETGGRALDWQVEGHLRRAHGPASGRRSAEAA